MSPEIKCIIIDDETKAIELLSERLKLLFPQINILGAFNDWKKGLEKLRTESVDILFLDVSMPEKSGLDFLKLFSTIPFQVIFITAHDEFAIQAIKFSAAGYVLKPIDDYELSFAVNKAIERINDIKPKANNEVKQLQSLKIGIPNVKGIDYLRPEDILYFESVNKYTKVVTKDYSIMSSYNLAEFRKIIDTNLFVQVHRSFLVNIQHIKRYETNGLLIMEDNMEIPVARNFRNDFLNEFSKIGRIAGAKGKETE